MKPTHSVVVHLAPSDPENSDAQKMHGDTHSAQLEIDEGNQNLNQNLEMEGIDQKISRDDG